MPGPSPVGGSRRLHPQGGDRVPVRSHTRSVRAPDRWCGQRLRELPMIYILILVIAIFWKYLVLGIDDPTQSIRLHDSSWWPSEGSSSCSRAGGPSRQPWLKALELGMIGMLAAGFAFVQYRLMLDFSLRDDPMMAQLTMKNIGADHRDPDPHLRALRPEELAPSRA